MSLPSSDSLVSSDIGKSEKSKLDILFNPWLIVPTVITGILLLLISANRGLPATPEIVIPDIVISWDWWGVLGIVGFILLIPAMVLFIIVWAIWGPAA